MKWILNITEEGAKSDVILFYDQPTVELSDAFSVVSGAQEMGDEYTHGSIYISSHRCRLFTVVSMGEMEALAVIYQAHSPETAFGLAKQWGLQEQFRQKIEEAKTNG